MISEYCRTGRCSQCQNPACEHECHLRQKEAIRRALRHAADSLPVRDDLPGFLARLREGQR